MLHHLFARTLPALLLLTTPAPAQRATPAPDWCATDEVGRLLREHLDDIAAGVIQAPVAPTIPSASYAPGGAPGVVTTQDFFLFEDSAGLLAGPYGFSQLQTMMVKATNALMAQQGDVFDFVGFWLSYKPSSTIGAAFYLGIENDVSGIGQGAFNSRPSLGIGGNSVEGFVMMWDVDSGFWAPGTGPEANFTRLALGQEFEHRFAMFLSPLLDGSVLQGNDSNCGRSAHWSWRVDGQGSAMEIAQWVGANPASLEGSFVNFNTDIAGGLFSYADLYLMGLVSPSQMDAGFSELRFMTGSNCSSTFNGPIRSIRSADLIASNGPRIPDSTTSQKDFRTGWVMFHLPGQLPTQPQLQRAADILNQFTTDWDQSTLSVSTMDSTLPLKSAAALPYGCGVNTPGSLTLMSGLPSLGDVVRFGIDNPLASQPVGSLPLLSIALAPDPAFPCGTSIPGWGMAGGGAPGELLLSTLSPNPLLLLAGPPWTGPGNPAPIALAIPSNPALLGLSLYTQGFLFDATLSGTPFLTVTDAVELRVGP